MGNSKYYFLKECSKQSLLLCLCYLSPVHSQAVAISPSNFLVAVLTSQSAWTGFKSLFGQRRRLGAMDMLKGAAGAVKGKALEAARKVATPLCQKAAYAIAEKAASKVLGDKFDNDGKSCLKEIVDAKCVEKVNAL